MLPWQKVKKTSKIVESKTLTHPIWITLLFEMINITHPSCVPLSAIFSSDWEEMKLWNMLDIEVPVYWWILNRWILKSLIFGIWIIQPGIIEKWQWQNLWIQFQPHQSWNSTSEVPFYRRGFSQCNLSTGSQLKSRNCACQKMWAKKMWVYFLNVPTRMFPCLLDDQI